MCLWLNLWIGLPVFNEEKTLILAADTQCAILDTRLCSSIDGMPTSFVPDICSQYWTGITFIIPNSPFCLWKWKTTVESQNFCIYMLNQAKFHYYFVLAENHCSRDQNSPLVSEKPVNWAHRWASKQPLKYGRNLRYNTKHRRSLGYSSRSKKARWGY